MLKKLPNVRMCNITHYKQAEDFAVGRALMRSLPRRRLKLLRPIF